MTDDSHDLFKNYRLLGREVWRRTRVPVADPTFVIVFILVVLGFGGVGVWLELYVYISSGPCANLAPLRTALMTLLPALAGSAALQATLAENKKIFRVIAFFTCMVFLPTALLVGPSSSLPNTWSFSIGIAAWITAAWIWWITNADQPDFRSKFDPDNPLGGDNLTGDLPGDLDKFEH